MLQRCRFQVSLRCRRPRMGICTKLPQAARHIYNVALKYCWGVEEAPHVKCCLIFGPRHQYCKFQAQASNYCPWHQGHNLKEHPPFKGLLSINKTQPSNKVSKFVARNKGIFFNHAYTATRNWKDHNICSWVFIMPKIHDLYQETSSLKVIIKRGLACMAKSISTSSSLYMLPWMKYNL
jgi:hypothetical protein